MIVLVLYLGVVFADRGQPLLEQLAAGLELLTCCIVFAILGGILNELIVALTENQLSGGRAHDGRLEHNE